MLAWLQTFWHNLINWLIDWLTDVLRLRTWGVRTQVRGNTTVTTRTMQSPCQSIPHRHSSRKKYGDRQYYQAPLKASQTPSITWLSMFIFNIFCAEARNITLNEKHNDSPSTDGLEVGYHLLYQRINLLVYSSAKRKKKKLVLWGRSGQRKDR